MDATGRFSSFLSDTQLRRSWRTGALVFWEAALKIVRTYIELRYTLLPYIYTAFHQYVNEFTPMLKPISMFDQSDQDTLYRVDEF